MLLLYNAAISCTEQARNAMIQESYEDAHALLVKAENCVLELSSGLRRDVFPELVENLSRLFEYVFYKLFEGNVSHNPQCMSDALNVLMMLRDAWSEAVAKTGAEAGEARPLGESGSVELSA